MTDEEAEKVMILERQLTDWMREQPVSVEWSIMALGISAARLIFGVGSLQGHKASDEAAKLLNTSIERAIDVFKRQVPPKKYH